MSGRWVIHAPARSARPRATTEPTDQTNGCPFCPGNETATPPEILRVGEADAWQVRVFPNLYPAVEPPAAGTRDPAPLPTPGGAATGCHEVVVFTPDHDATFADLDDDSAAAALHVLADRVREHRAAGRAHVQPFVNQGREAGATVEHPHGQILALDVIPSAVEREEHVLDSATCPLCGLADTDSVVTSRDGLLVSCPSWAAGPFEMLVAPKGHAPASEIDPAAAGPLLRDALASLRRAAGPVPYNVALHASLRHWHLHISPRTTTAAGFELASGLRINPSSPDDDRERLRRSWDG